MAERSVKLHILLLRSYTPLRRRAFSPSAVTVKEHPDFKLEIDCPKLKQFFPDFFYNDILVMADHRRESLSVSHRPRPQPIISVQKRLIQDRLSRVEYQFYIVIVRLKPKDPRDCHMFPGFKITCELKRKIGETTQQELSWEKIVPANQFQDASARFSSMLMDLFLDKRDLAVIGIVLDFETDPDRGDISVTTAAGSLDIPDHMCGDWLIAFYDLLFPSEKGDQMLSSEEVNQPMHHCVPKLDNAQQLFSDYKRRMEKLRTFRRAANNQMGKISFERYYRLEEIKSDFCEHLDGFFEFAKVGKFVLEKLVAVRQDLPTSQVSQEVYIVKKVLEWIAYEKHETEIRPLDNKLSSTGMFVIDRTRSENVFFWRDCHVENISGNFVFQNMKRVGEEIHLTGKPVRVEFPGEHFDGTFMMLGRNLLASVRTVKGVGEIVIINFSQQPRLGVDSKMPITKAKHAIPDGEYTSNGWISGDVIFVVRFMQAKGDTPQEYVFDAYTMTSKKEKLLSFPVDKFMAEDDPESHSVEYIASRAKLYAASISEIGLLWLSSWHFDRQALTATPISTNFFKDELGHELSIHPQTERVRLSFRMIRRQVFCFVAFNANKLAMFVANKKDSFSLLRIHKLKQNRIFLSTSKVDTPCSFYSYKKISSDDDPYNTYQIYRLQLKF